MLTIDYVLKKEKYLQILRLLQEYYPSGKKITIDHLRYAFIKNYKPSKLEKEKMEDFFSITPYNKLEKQRVENEYKNEVIDRKTYLALMKYLKLNTLDLLKLKNKSISNESKISGDANLRKYLRHLKNLKLIELKKPKRKKEKPYYQISNLGLSKTARLTLHDSIDTLIPDNTVALFQIQGIVIKLGLLFKVKEWQKKGKI